MPDPSLSPLQHDLGQIGSTRSLGLLDAALRLVTSLASFTVRGADGVSITLARHGQMSTVAASDDTVRRMDEHQYATGEGPCLAAAAEGRAFNIVSLADEARWPSFVPLAVEQGIASISSTPLMVSALPVGAINMYSHTVGAFAKDERDVAAFFSRRAAEILGSAVEVDADQGMRISDALTSRDVIAMAQGVHMSRLSISAEAAAAELHRAARAKEITVRDEALAVLASTRSDADGPGADGPGGDHGR